MASNTNPKPKHPLTPNPNPSTNKHLPQLPRELIDQILSMVIDSHSHDPAHQWHSLRHLTRYHTRHLEQEFLQSWLPKLTITVSQSRNTHVTYRAHSVNNKTGDGSIARFKAKEGWNELYYYEREEWARNIWNEEKKLIVRLPLGDDVNDPYYEAPDRFSQDGGWTFSRLRDLGLQNHVIGDCWIPGLSCSDDGTDIYFDWKGLFTTLFREEMFMRYVTRAFVAKAERTMRVTKLENVRLHMVKFLRTDVQLWRRMLLFKFREHRAQQPNTPFPILQDWLEVAWDQDVAKERSPTWPLQEPVSILWLVMEEESMVFSMSGKNLEWREFGEEEIKRLRAEERCWRFTFETGRWMQNSGRLVCAGG